MSDNMMATAEKREAQSEATRGSFRRECEDVAQAHARKDRAFVEALRATLQKKCPEDTFFSALLKRASAFFGRLAMRLQRRRPEIVPSEEDRLSDACKQLCWSTGPSEELFYLWSSIHGCDVTGPAGDAAKEILSREWSDKPTCDLTSSDGSVLGESKLMDFETEGGIMARGASPGADPMLDAAKKARLKALLAKPDATDEERKQITTLLAEASPIVILE
jgi:hypothetical protein